MSAKASANGRGHRNGRARSADAAADPMPPYDLAAQAALLGSMILAQTPEELERLKAVRQRIRPTDFYRGDHAAICAAVYALLDAGKPVDLVTLPTALRVAGELENIGGTDYLATLVEEVPSASNIEHYADTVLAVAVRREAFAVAEWARRAAADPQTDAGALLDGLRSRLQDPQQRLAAGGAGVFPPPVPLAGLAAKAEGTDWLVEGLIARKNKTLFSAVPKAGKTSLVAHLLREAGKPDGGVLAGLRVAPFRAVIVSEEHESLWIDRRDDLRIEGGHAIICRPFRAKPTHPEWVAYLAELAEFVRAGDYGAVIIDTLADLWPVENENDAGETVRAMYPLNPLTEAGAALVLVHHLRKMMGAEGTANRGSGAIVGKVDIVAEFRRFDANTPSRRVIDAVGRPRETLRELVLQLSPDGQTYQGLGDRSGVTRRDCDSIIADILPATAPGWTPDEVRENWPANTPCPGRSQLYDRLSRGAKAGRWSSAPDPEHRQKLRYFAPETADAVTERLNREPREPIFEP